MNEEEGVCVTEVAVKAVNYIAYRDVNVRFEVEVAVEKKKRWSNLEEVHDKQRPTYEHPGGNR